MTVMLSLFAKGMLEARWMLGIISAALFGLSWWFVHFASRIEAALKVATRARRATGMLRGLGGAAMDYSSAAIEMSFWTINTLIVPMVVAIWAISRGSGAVAGEIEKGTMDLVLSRPVARSAYLGSQVAVAVVGLLVIVASMMAGNLAGAYYNHLENPLSALALTRPALNLVAYGWAIFGYTFLVSSADYARWRPTLIGSVATLAGFIALVISGIPSAEEWKWLEKVSIFKAYNPVEVVTAGETLAFNAGVLGAVGGVGIILGFLIFSRRDLPAGS